MMPEIIGLIFRKKFPRKKPNRIFIAITLNFVFLPFEKIVNTTAAIQKNAIRTAMINCL